MKTYPICLVGLEIRRAVVIGGGQVAARKAQALLEAGGSVNAISPLFCEEFNCLAKPDARLVMVRRQYQAGDLEGAFLVVAATDDPAVNRAVWGEGLKQGCLINVVDDPEHSNFIVPGAAGARRQDRCQLPLHRRRHGRGAPALAAALHPRQQGQGRQRDISPLREDTRGDMLFREEFLQLKERDDLRCLLTVDKDDTGKWKDKVGVVTTLFKDLGPIDAKNTVAAVCGPPIMYKFVMDHVVKLGIPKHQILMTLERRMKCGVGKCGHCAIE